MAKVKIYQIKDFEKCNYVFRSYDKALEHGFNPQDYKIVYECEREDNYTFDNCFSEFNINRPEDFEGHSLSVSDVVCIDGKFAYCDDCGWEELDESTSSMFELNTYIENNYTPKVMIVHANSIMIQVDILPNNKLLNLNYMQKVVGGHIEFVHIPLLEEHGIDMICNDDGLLLNMEPSVMVFDGDKLLETIVGNVLFVKNQGEDVTGLDEEQVIFLEHLFEKSHIAIFNKNEEPVSYMVKKIQWERNEPLPQA